MRLMLTACGCPGASTLIRMLRKSAENEGRELYIIGTDMDNEAVGRFMVDEFYRVPHGNDHSYSTEIQGLVYREKPDVLLPESSDEVRMLSVLKRRLDADTRTMVSEPWPMITALNKASMYDALEDTEVEIPQYRVVESSRELAKASAELGYPDKPVVIKPVIGKGSRGVRILDSRVNRAEQLLYQKPVNKYSTLDEIESILSGEPSFPEMLVMEYLEGEEVATDVICMDGRTLLTTVKTVEQAKWGVIVRGELVDRPELVKATERILEAIPLSYCVNLQFIGGKLIEINPRVSSFIYQDDLVQPWLAMKMAMGEITEDEVRKEQRKVRYGRRMIRYMDQTFYGGRSTTDGN